MKKKIIFVAIFVTFAITAGCSDDGKYTFPNYALPPPQIPISAPSATSSNGVDGDAGKNGVNGVNGADGKDSNVAKSGPRIKIKKKTFSFDDGAEDSFKFGYFDSQRNENCSPSLASDGLARCLPSGIFASDDWFTNASCTTRAAWTIGCEVAKYITTTQEQICGQSRVSVFTAEKVNSIGAVFIKYANGTCSPTTLAGAQIYAFGTEIMPSQFAKITVTESIY